MGITKPTNLFQDLFKPAITRPGNYFCHLVGIDHEQGYNDLLALFDYKHKTYPTQMILFSTTIPKPNDPELIKNIMHELQMMKIGHYEKEEINLVPSPLVNLKVKQALDQIVPDAIQKENFPSLTSRNNFIAKLCIWVNLYVESIDFEGDEVPKCVFYGETTRHEAYFLTLLALIGMDVIYLNPSGHNIFEQVDYKGLSHRIVLGNTVPLLPFGTRAEKGVAVEKVTTYAKQASMELNEALYEDSGIYKPWQFAKGTTHAILMDAIIEDTLTYWDEPAKLRPGFKVTGQTVYVPVFFNKVIGAHQELDAYYDFIGKLKEVKNCLFVTSSTLVTPSFTQQDAFSLAFCLNSNKTINRDAIREHHLYKRFLTFRKEFQEFILGKIDAFFNNYPQMFVTPLTDKERVKLLATVLTAPDAILNLIDSFDFTAHVPKVVLYLNGREAFTEENALLLALLHTMAIDITILSPNGANNIELHLVEHYINYIKLDQMVYDLPLKTSSKKGFFSKFFR